MQAFRSSAAVTAAVLLVVFQVTSAYVVPEVIMMRVKRSPEPMRSFSFSGFNPNGQMAAFTGAMEYPAAFGNAYGPPPRVAGPYYGQPGQDSYGPPHGQDSYGPPPSGIQEPPADADPNKKPYGPVSQSTAEYGSNPADSKEPNGLEQVDGSKKQYKGRDGPSSNAEASFNAWFPIMFGVFPNGAGGQSTGNSAGRGNQNQGQGQDQGNSYGGGFERSSGGTTVIANSVSNGRHGVATSHAIAYGNPRSQK